MSIVKDTHPFNIYNTIMGAPEKLQSWLRDECQTKVRTVAEKINEIGPRRLYMAGTGSSYMASISQAYSFSEIAGISSFAFITSELRTYMPKEFCEKDVLFINTHSGKSPGDVEMVRSAKARGVYTIGVTDIDGTEFAEEVDLLFIGNDGPKKEMPATRTYSSSMYRMNLLAIEFAKRKGFTDLAQKYERQMSLIPGMMKKLLGTLDSKAPEIVERLADHTAFFVVSAGTNISTAFEGAMGLTQGTGMPCAGFNVDEYMHGPVQSLQKNRCIVTVAPDGPFHEKIWRFADVARKIGATVLMMAPEGSSAVSHGDIIVELPRGLHELLTPPIFCAPFWLIGYHFSLKKGFNPDSLSMEKHEFKNSGLADMKKYI